MTEEQKKEKWIAEQLRQPNGPYAADVGNLMNKGNRILNERVLKELAPNKHDNVTEVGMGNGAFVERLLRDHPTINYQGFDFSETMVVQSEKNNRNESRAEFALAQADNLPVYDAYTDLLFTVNTIYFWDDEKSVLNEFYRILKPEGQLVIGMRPGRSLGMFGFTKYGVHLFEPTEVINLLEETGFKVTEVLDKPEPDDIIDGEVMKLDTLIIKAEKV